MKIIDLAGSPREMGQAFGEACRDDLRAFYDRRVENAIAAALKYGGQTVCEADVIRAATSCLAPTKAYDAAGFEELEGIAQGANMDVVQVLATNGLTDVRDILSWPGHLESFGGCSAFIVPGTFTADDSLICGQTWDLATDNLPYVIGVRRKPTDGPATWSLTTVGCLSLIGMNEEGICVGTTNIRTTDTRPGVTYLSIIHKALAQRDARSAVSAITDAQRAGAHFYYVAAPSAGGGRAFAIECSATEASVTKVNRIADEAYVHCNHCLVDANIAIEGHDPQGSSLARQSRLMTLAQAGDATMDSAMGWMADSDNGKDAICRDDFDGINTNGAVIMCPNTGEIRACKGLPADGNWLDLKTGAAV